MVACVTATGVQWRRRRRVPRRGRQRKRFKLGLERYSDSAAAAAATATLSAPGHVLQINNKQNHIKANQSERVILYLYNNLLKVCQNVLHFFQGLCKTTVIAICLEINLVNF